MGTICDFASPQDLTAVKAHFSGIARYVSDYAWKNITVAEFSQAMVLGLDVLLVCEQGNQPAMRGTPGGIHDATIANDQANALGYDGTATIYAVAEDPNVLAASAWPTVEAYFTAFKGYSARPVGAYGSLALVSHLMDMGLASKGWTVQTWGGSSPQMHLEQLVGANTFGLSVDADTVLQADYGQHPRPSQPPPIEEEIMPVSNAFQWNGQLQAFQVSIGTLWHKWGIGTAAPANESVSKFAPKPITVPDQTPQWSIAPPGTMDPHHAVLVCMVEDSNKVAWGFAQTAGAGTWQVWELI